MKFSRMQGLAAMRTPRTLRGRAANSCSGGIPVILLKPKTPSRAPWPSPSDSALAATSCSRRSRSRNPYQAIGRPVEAHAILAPALEGFSPTPEMA